MIEGQLTYSLKDLPKVVKEIQSLMQNHKIFALMGSLGAGKTTLIKEVLKESGIKEAIVSPTFSYVNSYKTDNGQTFYHFDLYRLKSLQDFTGAGFGELLQQANSWVFIEWPEIIIPILKNNACIISIDYKGFDERILNYKCF